MGYNRETENFGIKNEYQDGQCFADGFFPRKRKLENHQSKDDHLLYGGYFISGGFLAGENSNNTEERRWGETEKETRPRRIIGDFSKHTTAFGLKILKELGYKGAGVGMHLQGIKYPIEQNKRPKNVGLGFDNCKEVGSVGLLNEQEQVSLSQLLDILPEEKLWSKHCRSKKKKNNYVTAEELLVNNQEQTPDVVHKVFDMRGSQVRVLTNLYNLNAEEEKSRENDVLMPEVPYNVSLIVQLVELDIQKIDRDLENERATVNTLLNNKEKLKVALADQKKELNHLEEIARVLEDIDAQVHSGTLTVDSLDKLFGDLRRQFPDEYKLCDLPSIACAFALPLCIQVYQGWDPLQDPAHELGVISLLKNLLQGDDETFGLPYTQLLMEVVYPALRISVNNSWDPRDPEPMLRFLESWEQLLPQPTLQSILDNIVLPKLSAAVDSWDPCQETIPIHYWVHPWLPFLGQKLEGLYYAMYDKLEGVLRLWRPSDISAYQLLSPWKSVFDPALWEQVIVQHILPKLLAFMDEFQANEGNQEHDVFSSVLNSAKAIRSWATTIRTWATVIPVHYMLHVMDGFISKWQEVMYQWLCLKSNFSEFVSWYMDVKNLIPTELLSNVHIQYRLIPGVVIMNEAAEGREVDHPDVRQKIGDQQRLFLAQQKETVNVHQRHTESLSLNQAEARATELDMSLKETIEVYAQLKGLIFKPKPGRMQDGHQVYCFGNVSITVDSFNRKVFAQTEDRWSLVASLEQLLELEKHSALKRH